MKEGRDILLAVIALFDYPLRLEGVNHKEMDSDKGTLNENDSSVSLLGLMAKIKCSICSYQFNI